VRDETGAATSDDAPTPSATVVVLRAGTEPLEVLLLERAGRERPWVFPGGKLDAADRLPGADEGLALRRAAVREAREEAGLALEPAGLLPISRWITPEISPRRFDTLFFAARAPAEAQVRVDGGEIAGHRWLAPRAALEAQRASRLRLAPPTFVTLSWFADFDDADAALSALAAAPLVTFRPRIHSSPDGACILYPGDAGYEVGDIACPGARHRLWTEPSGWRYERSA
jgi:8-oxo-dGTP pyrophosphatase MutT (NUDIX family)